MGGPAGPQTWLSLMSQTTLDQLGQFGSTRQDSTMGYLSWLAVEIDVRVDMQRYVTTLLNTQNTPICEAQPECFWLPNRAMDNQQDLSIGTVVDIPSVPAKPDKAGVYRYKMFWRNRHPQGSKGFLQNQTAAPASRYALTATGFVPYTAEEYVRTLTQLRSSTVFNSVGGIQVQHEAFMKAMGFDVKNLIRYPMFIALVPSNRPGDNSVNAQATISFKVKGAYVVENKQY